MRKIFLSVLGVILLLGCAAPIGPDPALIDLSSGDALVQVTTAVTPITLTQPPPPTPPLATAVITPTFTPTPAPSLTPTQTATATATRTPTPTPTILCTARQPGDDLLTVVSREYGLGDRYEPNDLIDINEIFGSRVTKNYPVELRVAVVEPLLEMVRAMEDAGLRPQIVSGYRGYHAQALAYQKWAIQYPNRVDTISARPGHSEHQLGTTVDFTSPELPRLTGDPSLEFHTAFSRTSEGIWLSENAHIYGFTLSYPADSYAVTGFQYEPWHYRYVGVNMATRLRRMGIPLIQYQMQDEQSPCYVEE